MALIICKECGKEVSNTAKFCPHCGYRNLQKNGGKLGVTSLVFGILAIVYAFSCSVTCYYAPETATYAVIWVLIFSILAVVFGLASLKKWGNSNRPKWGLALGSISLVVAVIILILS